MTGLGGRFLFVLSLWLSLATAVVCALVPAGLPLTRTTGSAFDPSTTIVALRSRPPAPIKAILQRIGEGDGAGAGAGAGVGDGPAALAILAPVAVVGTAILLPASGLLPPAFVLLPRALPVALHARPPPAA